MNTGNQGIQGTQEFATNTSIYHLSTNRVRVQLDSTLQDHLNALTKPTRGIERANHHSQLLQTTIDTKRPPRGLIPKGSPKIPDTPGTFQVEWENSLQEVGLVLTKNFKITGPTESPDLRQNTLQSATI